MAHVQMMMSGLLVYDGRACRWAGAGDRKRCGGDNIAFYPVLADG